MNQLNLPLPKFKATPTLTAVAAAVGTQSVVRAAAVTRPVSTLTPDSKFNLTPAQRRQGFFYLYYGLTRAKRSTWTWMSLITAALFPSNPQRQVTPVEEKKVKTLLQEHGKKWTSINATLLTKVKKDSANNVFQIKVPLMVFDNTVGSSQSRGLTTSTYLCLKPAPTPEQDPLNSSEALSALNDRLKAGATFDLAQLQLPEGSASLDARDLKALQDCKASLHLKRFDGNFDLAELTLEISKEQVEYLTNTEWLAIRPIDVYGPVFEWVDTQYGRFGKASAFSLPLKRIASSIQGFSQEEAKPRLSADGILVDEHGSLLWMPESLTDINRFEDAMNAAYQQPDGTFTAIPEEGGKPVQTPPSMPVLIDWVNLKFSYTTLTGRLNIKNLDRTYVANATHITRFVSRKLADDRVKNFISMTLRMSDFYQIPRDGFTVDSIGHEAARLGNRRDAYGGIQEIPLTQLHVYAEPNGKPGDPDFYPYSPACRTFIKVCDEVLKRIAESPETAYSRYSVLTILELRAQLIAFTVHAKDPAKLKAEDVALRSAYVNQGEAEDYKLTPVPYVQDQLGMMPHQVKVANVTRERPNHIFFPIDAGGGKCLHGSTLVPTSEGILTLEELYTTFGGKASASDKGLRETTTKFHVRSLAGTEEVTHVYRRTGNLWKLVLGDNTTFKGLKEHRFWTQDGWKRIDQLSSSDWICAPESKGLFPSSELTVRIDHPYMDSANWSTNQTEERYDEWLETVERFREGIRVTTDLAFVLGSLVAEGRGASFCNLDEDFLKLYSRSYEKVFGTPPKCLAPNEVGLSPVFLHPSNHLQKIILSFLLEGGNLSDKYTATDNSYSHEKSVPVFVRQSPKKVQAAFLRGWFEGDACVYGQENGVTSYRVDGGSASGKLVCEIAYMLRNFGISTRLHRSAWTESKKSWVSLQGGRGEAVKKNPNGFEIEVKSLFDFERKIGFASPRKSQQLSKSIEKLSLQQGGVNLSSQGRTNRVPAKFVESVVDLISEFAKTISYSFECKSKFEGSTANCTRTHSFMSISRQFRRSVDMDFRFGNRGNLGGYYTKHAAESLLRLATKSPLLKPLRKENPLFQAAIHELESSTKANWSRVVSVCNLHTKDYVYDLSVPGTNSYVANGYFSHNTITCIYDLLREIENGEVGPFVIMCPAHLVAQYVKELVYATNGRMNCVPITTYTIRRQGFDRLKAMITSAPINFCMVVDYDVIDLGSKSLSYGVAPVKVFPVIEFIRQFSPKYVFCDEAHMLRNEGSRQSATNRLIADIPKKRMASGTLVTNTILDLARQTALMDPTVFGTTDDFITEYALEMRGSKVIQWKPGAELAVRQQMRENAVLAEAKRKEWAAILPYPKERFHSADLTEKQQEVYKQILKQTIDDLQKKMEENERLRQLFNPSAVDGEEPEEANIDKLLKPFLARLERFLTAPSKDPLGKAMLTGDDAVSPKARKVVEICREHIEQNIAGKILIFTSYEYSAQAVYEALEADPVLKGLAIYYTADRKEECGADFEKNPDKKILVGIEFSMNTGLNLQFASRLLRLESVWTPGILEQGNSRIGRPNLKDKESRPYVYYDWIIANKTIDVTKASYLMAKTISKSKFDEAGNPRFDDLEVPPLLSMNMETIAETNDFNESLLPYFKKYEAYRKALFAEFDEYREKNKSKLFDEKGNLKLVKVERSSNPEGSKLMLRVPYVPGMEVYSSDKLGLVRYDAFMRLNLNEEDEAEDSENEAEDNAEENEDTSGDPQLEAERKAAAGLAVHTDRGDGTIVRVNKATLQVELPSGERIKVRKMASFIITRADTSNSDVRTQLLKMAGDVPIDAPVEVLETKLTDKKRRQIEKQQKQEQEENPIPAIDLEFTVVNDYLGLRIANFADDDRLSSVLQSLGFKYSMPYFAAHVPTAQHLLNLAKKWQEAGFEVDKENSEWLRQLYTHMKNSRKAAVSFFGIANQAEITNFYRMEFKPNPNDTHINPFPLIQDDQLYVAMPSRGQPGSRRSIRECRVPGVKWFEYEAGSELIAFTPSKAKASSVIQKILSMGLQINNLEKLKKQFAKLRIARDIE